MTTASTDRPWIPMCCNPEVLYSSDSNCYRADSLVADEMILPTIYNSELSISSMDPKDFVPRYGMHCLDDAMELNYLVEEIGEMPSYRLFENGTLHMKVYFELLHTSLEYWFGTEDYCFSSDATEYGTNTTVTVCESFYERYIHDVELTLQKYFFINTVIAGISLPFLAATFLVYTILPELNNVHGWILRSFIGSFFVQQIFYFVIVGNILGACAYLMNLSAQFLLLAIAFWLNAMCFDIWWTFRTMKSMRGTSKQKNRKKFIFYALYAWGIPLLITGVGSMIDSFTFLPEGFIKPGLRGSCWFDNDVAEMIYLDGPIALMLVCNIYFFIATATKMIQHNRDASHMDGSTNCWKNNERQRYNLCLKLFFVMGIGRVADFVLQMLPGYTPQYLLILLSLPNSLQGPTIFIIFVWKDKIKILLLKRLECRGRKCCWSSSSTTTGCHQSASNTSTTTTMTTLREFSNSPSEHSEPITEENSSV